VRIEECRPISKRKTWIVVERNGQSVGDRTVAAESPTAEPAAAQG